MVNAQPNGKSDNAYPELCQIYLHYKICLWQDTYVSSPWCCFRSQLTFFAWTNKTYINQKSPWWEPSFYAIGRQCRLYSYSCKYISWKDIPASRDSFCSRTWNDNWTQSRHLYDLYSMMNKDFARKAVIDDILWESICHLRGIYTSMRDVDYTPDVCKRLQLIPIETFLMHGEQSMKRWRDPWVME